MESCDSFTPTVALTFLVNIAQLLTDDELIKINESVADLIQLAEKSCDRAEAKPVIRIILIGSDASWYIGDANYGVDHFDWTFLNKCNQPGTALSDALLMLKSIMDIRILGFNCYRTLSFLISNGRDEDQVAFWESLNSLNRVTKLSRDMRISISISDSNQVELEAFATRSDINLPNGEYYENSPLIFKSEEINSIKSLLHGFINPVLVS